MAHNKHKPVLLTPGQSVAIVGEDICRPALPKVKSIQPFGSKILVEILRDDEIMGTNLFIGEGKGTGGQDGAPQAYIVKLGPTVEASVGLHVGDRIYWTGKGTMVTDPETGKGRVRALLEVHNVLAVLEEDK
jgi:hypothetical protein